MTRTTQKLDANSKILEQEGSDVQRVGDIVRKMNERKTENPLSEAINKRVILFPCCWERVIYPPGGN